MSHPVPPPTPRGEVVDVLHGVEVPDPYRWLEDPTDPAVRAWVDAQRAVAAAVLGELPQRAALRDRLERLWSVPRRGVPWRRGASWFQLRNDGTQDQDVLWWAAASDDGPTRLPEDGAWSPLLDPNGWSPDGTSSLAGLAVTDDGARIAYGRSDAGSDWVSWQVVEVRLDGTTSAHDERVPWSKFSGVAWLPDGGSFMYGAYEPPPAGEEVTATTTDQRLQRHRVGRDPATDEVVHARPDHPEWGFAPHVAHGGRWLVLTVWRGTDPTTRIHVARLDARADDDTEPTVGEVVPLLDAGDARYDLVGVLATPDGRDELLVVTDRDAPLGRVEAVDLADPSRRRDVVATGDERIGSAWLVGGDGPDDPAWVVVDSLRHATSRLSVHDARTGAWSHDVPLPTACTVTAVTGARDDRAIHLGMSTFASSDELWHHDLVTGATRLVRPSAVPAPTLPIVTEQVFVHHPGGPDGTTVAIPVFLVHREDVTATGAVPTVLWGYGGFDIPITPTFRPAWRTWVDAGGLLAVACLRGGGEYGRAWHDAGRGRRRPAVEADALAVAAWLTGDDRGGQVHATNGTTTSDRVETVWTSPAHLGIEGRSNGGLLVGTCMTAAPTRFASAVPEVGVLDLLRFHRFTIGWAWTSDYGSPDDPDQFPVLHALSPYHRLLRDGANAAPATLITTADTDDRVVPAHSYKFAAALQAARSDAPIVLRVDVSAGHGAGKPVAMLLDERADVLAWHAEHLGLAVDPAG